MEAAGQYFIKMVNKKITLLLGFAFVLLISISAVNAFGVSSPYWGSNPLKMYAGETKVVNFNLQNVVGDEDATVKVVINQGSDIASLEKDIYFVKAGASDTYVPLTVRIPEGVIGTYAIALEFKNIAPGGAGGVAMGVGMVAGFDVIVSERPPEVVPETQLAPPKSYLSGVAVLIIILIAAMVFFAKRRKK